MKFGGRKQSPQVCLITEGPQQSPLLETLLSNIFTIKLHSSLPCLCFILWRFMIGRGKLGRSHRIWQKAPVKKATKIPRLFSRFREFKGKEIIFYFACLPHRVKKTWARTSQNWVSKWLLNIGQGVNTQYLSRKSQRNPYAQVAEHKIIPYVGKNMERLGPSYTTSRDINEKLKIWILYALLFLAYT